jgi:hypothetical protein
VKLVVLVCLTCLLDAGLAFGQSVVGKALVSGKVVTLFDDGTWKYADAVVNGSDTDCEQISPKVQFCANLLGWSKSLEANAEVTAAYRIDARHYAQFIIEDLGTDDGLSAEFMRQAVLENATMATGSKPEVIDVLPVTLGSLTGETVVYRGKFQGVSFVFSNSIFLEPKVTMQITTYAVAGDYTPVHASFQADLLANTKVAE